MNKHNIIRDIYSKIESIQIILAEIHQLADILNSNVDTGDIDNVLADERFRINVFLKKNNGSRKKTAEALGISERTLYRKMIEYDL